MDARKPQEGPREPREPRNREDRNNRRNKPDEENPSVPAPFGHVRKLIDLIYFISAWAQRYKKIVRNL